MADLHKLVIRGHLVVFYSFIAMPDWRHRVTSLTRLFERVPDAHLQRLYPIFLVNEKPGGQPGGGTWRPGTDWMRLVGGGRRAERTGVPDAELDTLIIRPHSGLIMIPRERWQRPINLLPVTVFHEVGHCVDYTLGLVPPRTSDAEFAGMNSDLFCGAATPRARQAVEVYARAIYRPGGVYHELPPGDSPAAANTRLLDAIRRAPAFHGIGAWPPPMTSP